MESKAELIHADRDRCVGAGNCAEIAPLHFSQREEDGTVVVLRNHAEGAEEQEAVLDAASYCPVAAIWVEAETQSS